MCYRLFAVCAHLQTEVNVRVSVNSLSGGQTDPMILRPVQIKDMYGLFNTCLSVIVQEMCESRGGRPGLSVLTSLLVSVDVKNY